MINTSIKITRTEYFNRADQLINYLQIEGLSCAVLFDRDYILYYTGFAFIPTERPIAFVLNTKGNKVLFVPRLEFEHALSNAHTNAGIEQVEKYDEYPSDPHPMEIFKDILHSLCVGGEIGVDTDGYPWIFGYRGPSLSGLTGERVKVITALIEDQMMIKSEAEISLIKESVKWGHLAHILLQRYTRVGLTETSVSHRASDEATLTMLDTIGPLYQAQSVFSSGAHAGYRGQIGRNAAIPHALANNITFQAGDVLVTGAGAPVWGYNSELERTMIIGDPTKKQKEMFDHMVNLQDLAFEVMKPGVLCSDVDIAIREYYKNHKLMPYWRHHVGHAIGIRYHEGPFLDVGDKTEIKPGMVFTVEPGLYSAEFGGFRHSDTVVISEDGIEMLTYYPRDLESLIIPV